MINAPGTIASLISAVSVVLSERQCAKIVVLAAPTPLAELTRRFRPDTLLGIMADSEKCLNLEVRPAD